MIDAHKKDCRCGEFGLLAESPHPSSLHISTLSFASQTNTGKGSMSLLSSGMSIARLTESITELIIRGDGDFVK